MLFKTIKNSRGKAESAITFLTNSADSGRHESSVLSVPVTHTSLITCPRPMVPPPPRLRTSAYLWARGQRRSWMKCRGIDTPSSSRRRGRATVQCCGAKMLLYMYTCRSSFTRADACQRPVTVFRQLAVRTTAERLSS